MAQYSLYRPGAAAGFGSLFEDLRRDMDALLGRYGSDPSGANGWRGVFPAVNLYEADDAFVLTAELPGVGPDDIQVQLEGSTVTLQGERKIEYPPKGSASLHRRERQAGAFRRAFELPAEIDADKVEAVHRHGVLMLRLPKTPRYQPRRISVRGS